MPSEKMQGYSTGILCLYYPTLLPAIDIFLRTVMSSPCTAPVQIDRMILCRSTIRRFSQDLTLFHMLFEAYFFYH